MGLPSWRSLMKSGVEAYFQQRWPGAEAFLQAARREGEDSPALDRQGFATTLYFLASTMAKQDRRAEAEPLFRRALDLLDAEAGIRDSEIVDIHAQTMDDLGEIYADRIRRLSDSSAIREGFGEAEELFQRALRLREAAFGKGHRAVGRSLFNLMVLYTEWSYFTEAEALGRRALAIFEEQGDGDDAMAAATLENLAFVLRRQNREDEARAYESRVRAIRARGPASR